jgi:hypothetical protein
MSINTASSVTLEPSSTEVEVTTQRDLAVLSSHDVDVQIPTSTIEGIKKEYSIVGDGIYASVSADEAPSWLTGIIDDVVANSVAAGMGNYDLLVEDVLNAIASIDVASNTYVEQIDITSIVDGIIASHLTTLNASIDGNTSTISQLSTTVATNNSTLALSVTALDVELSGEITSSVGAVSTALATETGVRASEISALGTSMVDGNGVLTTAISDLETSTTTAITATSTNVQNMFVYDSSINIGGYLYNAGFGLVTTGTTGDGSVGNEFDSEFWINAEKFKFTNTGQTGSISPFSIDSSGPTPQVTFNGIVSFSNTTGTPTHTTGADAPTGAAIDGSTHTETGTTPNAVWMYNSGWNATGTPNALVASDLGPLGYTEIDGGRITTDSITALQIDTDTLTADMITTGTLNAITLNGVDGTFIGTLNVASDTTGERMEINNNVIKVFDASNNLRVQIGDLSV